MFGLFQGSIVQINIKQLQLGITLSYFATYIAAATLASII